MENKELKNRFIDEKTGIEYIRKGDFYFPNLVDSASVNPNELGKYGKLRLKYLLEHKEQVICQKDLENDLSVSKATISEVLLTMEKSGLIKKEIVPNDARAKRIVLTNTSLERFQELEKNFSAINEKLIEGISTDELAHFLNILNKMQKNMNEEGE